MKFKNRLGAPESIHMRGFSPKNEQIWPRGLGCRGMCFGFWRLFTLYFNHFCTMNPISAGPTSKANFHVIWSKLGTAVILLF